MELTRRDAVALGMAGLAATAVPSGALAGLDDANMDNGYHEAVAEFVGKREIRGDAVLIDAPATAENGFSVPVTVEAEGALAILLLAVANPNAAVATFRFGPLAAESRAETRIRLARSQPLVAFAHMPDDTFRVGRRDVTVVVGGCGA